MTFLGYISKGSIGFKGAGLNYLTSLMQYWIMKSEPDVFSIDDLMKKKHQKEPWNGVRNYQARNFIKSMKPGDLAYFYHSSCAEPGIAGIVEICSSPLPDKTALDSKSEYFDPKSTPENPRWYLVEVQFLKKCKQVITLEKLKKLKGLEDLLILRKGNRLSITPISKEEFNLIQGQGSF